MYLSDQSIPKSIYVHFEYKTTELHASKVLDIRFADIIQYLCMPCIQNSRYPLCRHLILFVGRIIVCLPHVTSCRNVIYLLLGLRCVSIPVQGWKRWSVFWCWKLNEIHRLHFSHWWDGICRRQELYGRLLGEGLLDVLTTCMEVGTPQLKLKATDILVAMVQHDPSPVRAHLLRPPSRLFSCLVAEFTGCDENGVPEQVLELLKSLLDPDTMDQAVEKNEFLELFYDQYIGKLIDVLSASAPSKPPQVGPALPEAPSTAPADVDTTANPSGETISGPESTAAETSGPVPSGALSLPFPIRLDRKQPMY